MGIRDRPTAPRSPSQNAYVERLIGTIRRDCLDHLVIFSEAHLRRVLKAYADYYNGIRTHLSLSKDAPHPRAIQRNGRVRSVPHVGGLHHSLVRIWFSVATRVGPCGGCFGRLRGSSGRGHRWSPRTSVSGSRSATNKIPQSARSSGNLGGGSKQLHICRGKQDIANLLDGSVQIFGLS